MAEQRAFEPYAAFQRLDRHYRGYLTSTDLRNFLQFVIRSENVSRESGTAASEREVFAVLKHYDRDQDGKLSFKEFLAIVLPLNNPALRSTATQREPYKVGPADFLPHEVEVALSRLLGKEVETNRIIEEIKQDLASRSDFNLLDTFKNIDTSHRRFVDFANLLGFLTRKGAGAQPADVVAFVRRLDRDLDCRLSYMEFMDGMLPAEKRRRQQAAPATMPMSETKPKAPFTPAAYTVPASASKLSARPGSSLGSRSVVAISAYRRVPPQISYTTPAKQSAAGNRSRSIGRTVRVITMPRSDQKDYGGYHQRSTMVQPLDQSEEQDSPASFSVQETTSKRDTPLKSILKKKGSGRSPSKSVQISARAAESGLGKLMKRQARLERDIEVLKQDLAIRRDVTVQTLCEMFDPAGSGYVSPTDFFDAVSRLGLRPSRDEVYTVFSRFDRNADGRLGYEDIAEMFVPRQQEYAAIFANRSGRAEPGPESLELARRLVQQYLDAEQENRDCKRNMAGCGLREAFSDCDLRGRGFFDIKDVFCVCYRVWCSCTHSWNAADWMKTRQAWSC